MNRESREEHESLTEAPLHGYIKADHKDKLANRLKRIEGQVRGVERMVEREDYCVDVLTQISSIIAAAERVASILLRDHIEHCVRESIESGEDSDEKLDEVTKAIERFLKLERS